MRLDDAVLGDVIQALGAVAGSDENPRRRRAERYHCVADAMIIPVGVTRPVSRRVKLANISATGLCMIDQMNMSIGNRFIVSLPCARGVGLNVMCTVRQTRLTGAGGFRTGAEFTGEAEMEERMVSGVDGVVAKLPTTQAETRIAARIAIQADVPGEFIHATVREAKGENVVVDTVAQVAPGTTLIVEISPGHPDHYVLQCSVQNLLSIGDDQYRLWLKCIGREVVKPPGLFGWLRKRRP